MSTPPNSLENRIVREVMRRLAALGAPSDPTAPCLDDPPVAVIDGGVVTLAALEQLTAGVRQLRIAARTVVTPAATDWLAARGITLQRIEPEDIQPSPDIEMVVVTDSPGGVNERIGHLIDSLGRGGQRIEETCPDVLGRRVAERTDRGATCLWLTERPAVALCRANRHAGVRAAWAIDVPAVEAARNQLHANVWIAEPTRHSAFQWTRILRLITVG